MVKEHFEGIQMALIREVKEIKEIFEQMEAKVEQNVVDKHCDEIEGKNIFIENENLIDKCLFIELVCSVLNAVNIVSRFSKMHDAYTIEQTRNAKLKAEISELKHKVQKDDHSKMINMFPSLRNNREVHLDYLKHLKESVETLRDIVEEARIEKPLDNVLESTCFYTTKNQELLEYVIGTCLKEFYK
nr:hypothetical protein [Tanacetum cinerariifolium]